METVTRSEFNGLGERLRRVEMLETKVNRNETDIKEVTQAMKSLPMKILGVVSIPTVLMAWQILSK